MLYMYIHMSRRGLGLIHTPSCFTEHIYVSHTSHSARVECGCICIVSDHIPVSLTVGCILQTRKRVLTSTRSPLDTYFYACSIWINGECAKSENK